MLVSAGHVVFKLMFKLKTKSFAHCGELGWLVAEQQMEHPFTVWNTS